MAPPGFCNRGKWGMVYRGSRVRSPQKLTHLLQCTHILHNFWTSTHRGEAYPLWRRHWRNVYFLPWLLSVNLLSAELAGRRVRCTATTVRDRHGTGSLGHWVNGSFGSSFTSGSPGHHYDPVWDPSFPGFRKNAQDAKRTFEMLKWQKSLSGVCCWTEITGCQSMQWTFTFTYDY